MDDEQQNEHNALLAWILGIAVTIAVAVSLIVGIMAAMNSGPAVSTRAALPVGAAPAAGSAGLPVGAAPAAAPAAGSAAAPSAAAPATAAGATVAEVDVAPALATGAGYPALVKFHFDTAKFDLPADAAAQLAAIVDWAKAEPSARIGVSGFHDRHGDAAANALLARNRAVATRDALLAAGVPAERIVLVKPQETTGGADDREARRVDVYPAQ
ncbi:MAG TPA: OmpA family protein [Zeimonas sp.]|nr:OmpA family protein [Zeimonas sp.]